MCLNNPIAPTVNSGVGYKVVIKEKKGRSIKYLSWDCSLTRGDVRYIRAWRKDKNNKQLRSYSGQYYKTGFHVCMNLDASIAVFNYHSKSNYSLAVIEVEFKDAVAEDSSSMPYGRVVVARSIRLIKEIVS